MTRNNLYILVLFITFAGYIWTGIHLVRSQRQQNEATNIEVCLIKKVTGLPCPSCGTTSSVTYLLQGQFRNAVLANPLGFVMILAMAIFPVWIIFDLILNRNSFFLFYNYIEISFRMKVVAIPAVIIIITIWIWKIMKHL